MDEANQAMDHAEQEILDGILDRIQALNGLLADRRAGTDDPGAAAASLRRHAHSMKDDAATLANPALKAVAHRFEDYMAPVEHLEGQALRDGQSFVDRLDEVVERCERMDAEEIARVCRNLPAKHAFDVDDIEVRDIEVMLVMPEGAGAHYVTRELAECGYRLINVWSTADALTLAADMRPDFVIAANVMPELSGVDLACALRAMPATRGIPVAVLTSESRRHRSLTALPEEVPILSKSARFADDVTEVFSRAGLL